MSIKNTVLIIGATGGIGAALARSIYAQGKKVIITGRRQNLLSSMASELPGLETSCFDFSDIPALSSHVSNLTTKYPAIDTVIINAGVQNVLLFTDPTDAGKPESIANEVTTNLTAPIVLCQAIIPHFLKSEKPCSIILISSGLAFIAAPFAPVYCATKAAIHSFAFSLRSQLYGTNISVTEVFPQYIDTGLDAKHRDKIIEMSGGPEKAPKPMPLDGFNEQVMVKLDALEDGKPMKEIAVGAFPGGSGRCLAECYGAVVGEVWKRMIVLEHFDRLLRWSVGKGARCLKEQDRGSVQGSNRHVIFKMELFYLTEMLL